MRFPRRWSSPRFVYGLFGLEFCGTVAALAFFGIAAPDLFRTKLWEDGGLNGFNSNKNIVVYAYANYTAIPKIPLVWSQLLTNYNLVMSVLTMFVLLIKVVMMVTHFFHPPISLIFHLCLTAIWAVSAYGQAGPDNLDPRHPSPVAWYLRKSCSVVYKPKNKHYCELAKGTFAVTIIMLAIFVIHLPVAIWSILRDRNRRMSSASSVDSVRMSKVPRDSVYGNNRIEAAPEFPPPPKTPITPRTQAFNKLSNALPGRSHGKK